MPDAVPIIKLTDLRRDFKTTQAVAGISLSVAPGELFGLVGPDGAGKTTTLRLLAGLLTITAGEATILGFDLKSQAEQLKPHIGYMAQQFSLYAELSVLENLRFFAELFDVSAQERRQRTARLLAFAGLEEFKHRRAAQLSGGMQKKLALACTLIHQPEILLLDEPTTGVDPISRREFWNILTELVVRGTTIIVSTPYMDEADRCTRVGLMYQGKLVECNTPQNIRNRLKGDIIELRTEDWRAARRAAAALDGVREIQTYGEALHLLVDDGPRRLPQIAQALQASHIAYRGMRIAPPRMEEAFISLIRAMEA
jgi:ABC-2 type transport system ATP-binding protein